MQQASARRKDGEPDTGTRQGTPPPQRARTPHKRGSALSAGGGGGGGTAERRSGSQPKQRAGSNGKTRAASGMAASRGLGAREKNAAPSTPVLTPAEACRARMKQTVAACSSQLQLEPLLQQLLQKRRFEEAAYAIEESAFLAAKYKTSDVVRLMLEMKQVEKAGRLIRELGLQDNQLLVTVLIKELIRASLFQAAVRYAQEMVHNFAVKEGEPRRDGDHSRPSWTPQALVQAMIRARQFRTALKFAKQFELLDTFPPVQLVASMLDARRFEDAVTSVFEFRLLTAFPLEPLATKLLEQRQWSCALKCINKLSSIVLVAKYQRALVREAARVGDFLAALRYLREFKLDQPKENRDLLEYLVDCLIEYAEFYKAIKYSIKFGLADPPSDGNGEGFADADADEKTAAVNAGTDSIYATETLIRRAIQSGQYHVATTYIKKLKLKDTFADELTMITTQRARMEEEFRQFMRLRDAQVLHPVFQNQVAALLSTSTIHDEWVDQSVETELIVTREEEVFPRKSQREPSTNKDKASSPEDGGATNSRDSLSASTEEQSPADSEAPTPPPKQSRFSFARAGATSTSGDHQAPTMPQAVAPPPGLSQSALPAPAQPPPRASPPGFSPPGLSPPGLAPPGLSPPEEQQRRSESSAPAASSAFNFADFASALLSNASNGAPTPPGHLPMQFPGSQAPPPPQQQQQHPGPPPFNSYPPRQAQGYAGIPPPPMGAYYPNSGHPSYAPPPPSSSPMQPSPAQQSGPSGTFDISSLAMQFHARPPPPGPAYPGGYAMNNGAPRPGQYPMPTGPPLPNGMAGGMAGLFPPMPAMQHPQYPSQPMHSSFKPSMSYTSVTTTRQKKNDQLG